MNTLIFSKNEYILLTINGCSNKNEPIQYDITSLNNMFPELCDTYPLHLCSNDVTHIIIDTNRYLHIIYKQGNNILLTFSLVQLVLPQQIVFISGCMDAVKKSDDVIWKRYIEDIHVVTFNKQTNNLDITTVYITAPYDNENNTLGGIFTIAKNNSCMTIENTRNLTIIGDKLCFTKDNVLMCFFNSTVHSFDKIKLATFKNIQQIGHHAVYYIKNNSLYKHTYVIGPVKKITGNYVLHHNITNNSWIKDFSSYNTNENNILPIFCEIHMLVFLIIDSSGCANIVNLNSGQQIYIGYIGHICKIKTMDPFALIICSHDCYIINTTNDGIVCEKIKYSFNTSLSSNISFNNFVWSTRTHKYMSVNKQRIIMTFLLCNKLMGKFKIPYWLLYDVFRYLMI